MASAGNIELNHFDNRLNITVKVSREFRLRMWLAKHLLLLAARIARANIEIEEAE